MALDLHLYSKKEKEMKIIVNFSSKGYPVTKAEKTFVFKGINEARNFLIDKPDLDDYAIETKKHGFLCGGYDFVYKTDYYKRMKF